MLYLAEHDFEVGQTEEESLYFGILNMIYKFSRVE